MKLNRILMAPTNTNGRHQHKTIEISHTNKIGNTGKSHRAMAN